ncbi:MAG: hypothetical protein M0R06_03640 [Sphaerochaeta sp.]|jgi:hypothetical protein|nr:hypothetical protein [Sphaerochaeta sp.]
MAIVNGNARRGDGGRGGKERGQRFFSCFHYTLFSTRAQSPVYQVGMRLAVLLADAAEALAGAVWRWSIGA